MALSALWNVVGVMRPVYQQIISSNNGDCLRACVASILELEIEHVPNFMEVPAEWYDSLCDFLCGYSLYPIQVDAGAAHDVGLKPLGYHVVLVDSHALVGKNGRIVHDPLPDPGNKQKYRRKREWILFGVADPARLTTEEKR